MGEIRVDHLFLVGEILGQITDGIQKMTSFCCHFSKSEVETLLKSKCINSSFRFLALIRGLFSV